MAIVAAALSRHGSGGRRPRPDVATARRSDITCATTAATAAGGARRGERRKAWAQRNPGGEEKGGATRQLRSPGEVDGGRRLRERAARAATARSRRKSTPRAAQLQRRSGALALPRRERRRLQHERALMKPALRLGSGACGCVRVVSTSDEQAGLHCASLALPERIDAASWLTRRLRHGERALARFLQCCWSGPRRRTSAQLYADCLRHLLRPRCARSRRVWRSATSVLTPRTRACFGRSPSRCCAYQTWRALLLRAASSAAPQWAGGF